MKHPARCKNYLPSRYRRKNNFMPVLGFRSGAVEVYDLLEYGAALLGDWSRRFETLYLSHQESKHPLKFGLLKLEHYGVSKRRDQSPIDNAAYPRRTNNIKDHFLPHWEFPTAFYYSL
jgi:hypothetical protein